jgi:hypothetical protein
VASGGRMDPPQAVTGTSFGRLADFLRTKSMLIKVQGSVANQESLRIKGFRRVPPAGFEPAPPPPEGGALSPELRGLKCAEGISGSCALLSDA